MNFLVLSLLVYIFENLAIGVPYRTTLQKYGSTEDKVCQRSPCVIFLDEHNIFYPEFFLQGCSNLRLHKSKSVTQLLRQLTARYKF